MLYLTCTMISRVDLSHYGVSRDKGWVSVECGTMPVKVQFIFIIIIIIICDIVLISTTKEDISCYCC